MRIAKLILSVALLSAFLRESTAQNDPLTEKPQFGILDLGTLGGEQSEAYCINDHGDVVGYSSTRGGLTHAFVYSNGVMRDLGTLGGDYSFGYGINNIGQAVGDSAFEPGSAPGIRKYAFLYANGAIGALENIGGFYSYARAINDNNQVVGFLAIPRPTDSRFVYYRAFLRSNGTSYQIETLGGEENHAYGINAKGDIVGDSLLNDEISTHAFLYSNGSMRDLGTLGGRHSFAFAINRNGQVVGRSLTKDGAYHAFLYANGSMNDLGGWSDRSAAYGINDQGQVVGDSLSEPSRPFVYLDSSMRDPNLLIDTNLGWNLQSAKAINNAGQIVGYGLNPSGKRRAFLLSPRNANLTPRSIVGSVTDSKTKAPLVGATVKVMQGEIERSSTKTDSLGKYRVGNLATGIYQIWVTKDGFLTNGSLSVVVEPTGTASMDFALESQRDNPTVKDVSRVPGPALVPDAGSNGKLHYFDNRSANSNLPTIVLTHGWIKEGAEGRTGVSGWPTRFYLAYSAKNLADSVNIVAWDWRKNATDARPISPLYRTETEGLFLGRALIKSLGANYSQPIHFIGHSLGTIVNARAADFLHGDGSIKLSPSYAPGRTQMTLFDPAEILAVEYGISTTPSPLQIARFSPIPVRSRWVDNYISLTGYSNLVPRNQCVRVHLARQILGLLDDETRSLSYLHGYAAEWYLGTIKTPAVTLNSGIGNIVAVEHGLTLGPRHGTAFMQKLTGEYEFEWIPPEKGYPVAWKAVVSSAEIFADGVTAYMITADGFRQTGRVVADSVQNFVDGSIQRVNQATVENYQAQLVGPIHAWNLMISLKKGGGTVTKLNIVSAADQARTNSSYVWIPINMPSNAKAISFEFSGKDLAENDSLAVGIAGTSLLVVRGSAIRNDAWEHSGLIDISEWSGRSDELFVGLVSSGQSGGEVRVRSIEIVQSFRPELIIHRMGSGNVLEWPSSSGFILEKTDTLSTNATWSSALGTYTVNVVNGRNHVYVPDSGATAFFRLSQISP